MKDVRVMHDDKREVAHQADFDLACKLLTKQKNKERLARLNIDKMQEPNSYKQHQEKTKLAKQKVQALKEKLIQKRLRNDQLIRMDSKNAQQFDYKQLNSIASSSDIMGDLAALGFGISIN